MIVTCPNCGTRFRLAEAAAAAVAGGRRMKCAECGERWQPAAAAPPPPPPLDDDEELAVATAQLRGGLPDEPAAMAVPAPPPAEPVAASPLPAAPLPPGPLAAEPAPEPPPADEDDDGPPRRWPIVRTLVALVIGAAFAIAAAGLWVGGVDLSRAPPPFDRLVAALPAPRPLAIAVEGHVTLLPSGERLLEVTGTISNPGADRTALPVLRASLAGPRGVVRRWTIAPPVEELGPGGATAFASTVTGVPADATLLSIAAGR